MHRACVGVWIGLVLLPACVTRATHQATLDQLDAARGELQEAQRRAEERTAERDGCVRERAAGEAERRAELERLTGEIRAALTRIAPVLAGLSDRRFQVEGHTDNVPIRGARFASNWELSTARALAVVHLMVGGGLRAESISAAGFGEFQPRSGNDTEAGRRLNRRIEIVLLPDLGSFSGFLEPR